jgi:PBP1b-binding outer membrane lipoprotein LpoB
MIVLQILKSKEMKKIAFMFAAAAMFVACGNTQTKPAAEEVEAPVEEVVEVVTPVLTAEDSASVAAMFEGQEVADSVLQAAYDSLLNLKVAAEQVVDQVSDAVEAVEGAIEEVAQ